MIRRPAVAGLFYPADGNELRKNINTLLGNARQNIHSGKSASALIVPHAGYMYSGQTAAYAYAVAGSSKYDAVIIVGPSHHAYFRGISVFPGEAYRTPLGDAIIDDGMRDALCEGEDIITSSERGHTEEHSVEVQIPFLQVVFDNPVIVPVIMGDQQRGIVEILAHKLSKIMQEKNVLVIASTDLSHYHPYDTAIDLDTEVIRSVEQFDYEGLMRKLDQRVVEACGGGPMVSVMMAARAVGKENATILHYCNSGDITGDKQAVVGYLSASLN
jgi:MEMO1 family protein